MSEAEVYVLLPCPFCGVVPELVTYKNDRQWWTIRCGNDECIAHLKMIAGNKENLVTRWNMRPSLPGIKRLAGEFEDAYLDVTEEMPE